MLHQRDEQPYSLASQPFDEQLVPLQLDVQVTVTTGPALADWRGPSGEARTRTDEIFFPSSYSVVTSP